MALFFNRTMSRKFEYRYEKADTMLKIILVVFNTSFFLLHILTEPLQIMLLGG